MYNSKSLAQYLILIIGLSICLCNCKNSPDVAVVSSDKTTTYPSDVIPFMDEWKITLGDGANIKDIENFEHKDYFYSADDGEKWIVYKSPNSGGTTANSSNTRTELHHETDWLPMDGGELTGTLKVQHVSTTGDARVAASFSVVVGQIHSGEGHKNEPLKIFYKKFPGHTKGSVFWNYEINTAGDNSQRWDYSRSVWGYDMSDVGTGPNTYPEEPQDGIALGEEFSYVINVKNGIMHLTFEREDQEPVVFTKSLISSEFVNKSEIPQQIRTLYASLGREGVERPTAYAGELQFFKQGAYNQTNGKDPNANMVWSTGSETYNGDLKKQYANGSYTEVWFKKATVDTQ